MTAKRKTIALTVTLALFISSPAAASVIYQWTAPDGVLHFTDNSNLVPEWARKSPSFIVRNDLETTAPDLPQLRQMSAEPPVRPEVARVAEPMPVTSEPITTIYAPQDVTIIVVNSDKRHFKKDPCKFGAPCAPVFRPDFNNRQYIHPSVFNGGSRQYIHPSVFNATPRRHSGRR
jgi:Domain of unknown function (DUF4124)